jgi:excisionase family DNA binding protein
MRLKSKLASTAATVDAPLAEPLAATVDSAEQGTEEVDDPGPKRKPRRGKRQRKPKAAPDPPARDGLLGYLTRPELARELRVSQMTIRRLEVSQGFPVHRVGRKRLYKIEEIHAWIAGDLPLKLRAAEVAYAKARLRAMKPTGGSA